jgi:Holliday junction resolvase RusA-like endonuclease
MIRFTIPIAPKSMQNGGKRAVVRNGKPLFFKDAAARRYESALLTLAAAHSPVSPLAGAVEIDITLVMPRPKCLSRQKDPHGLIPAPKRPDWDNLCKSLLDPLTKLGFWRDDGQITDAIVRKRYAEKDGPSRIELVIRPMETAAAEVNVTSQGVLL